MEVSGQANTQPLGLRGKELPVSIE